MDIRKLPFRARGGVKKAVKKQHFIQQKKGTNLVRNCSQALLIQALEAEACTTSGNNSTWPLSTPQHWKDESHWASTSYCPGIAGNILSSMTQCKVKDYLTIHVPELTLSPPEVRRCFAGTKNSCSIPLLKADLNPLKQNHWKHLLLPFTNTASKTLKLELVGFLNVMLLPQKGCDPSPDQN